jgi:hypothetical protein
MSKLSLGPQNEESRISSLIGRKHGSGRAGDGGIGEIDGGSATARRRCSIGAAVARAAKAHYNPSNSLKLTGPSLQSSAVTLGFMSTVEEIEAAIQRLAPDEMAAFRAWYAEFDAAAWDRQIAEDEAAGRLDWLIQEALDDLNSGRCIDR